MATLIGYEIDFLPVGNGDRSGDAICSRWKYSDDSESVIVIDGGTKDSGEQIVKHIDKYYETDTVDIVVNTHPDADHSSGLTVVLESLQVNALYMHLPWDHSADIRDLFAKGPISERNLETRIVEAYSNAYELNELAQAKGITVYEPFVGYEIGPFVVLSPSEEWYESLLPFFRGTPKPKSSLLEQLAGFGVSTFKAIGEIYYSSIESFTQETLREGGKTSAENESSAVLCADTPNGVILLTGDAGTRSLLRSLEYLATTDLSLDRLRFVQVPHHGSRNNISPNILNALIGKPLVEGTERRITSFVSASKGSETHPRRVVMNAFYRRTGRKVIPTRGQTIRHSYKMPDRDGWTPVDGLPFFDQVEEYD